VVIFCETGLIITPFLPGDSLLLILGTLAAGSLLDLKLTIAITLTAAILGDTINYHIGKIIGPRVFVSDRSRFFNRKHITLSEKFYEKYGAKTLVIARFTPILRSFAPFVAGIGRMNYRNFLIWNVMGALSWTLFFIVSGYFFGNIPFVKENLTLIILGVIVLSFTPAIITHMKERKPHV
jgi:membrane-associated protein